MGGETYKINESGKGASMSLLFRFLRLHFALGVISFPLFYIKLGMDNYPMVLLGIFVFSLLVILTKREVDIIHFENGKITIRGKKFLFVPFKSKVEYTKIKYKYNKPKDKKRPALFRKTPKLVLFADNTKWAEFTGGVFGWGKPQLGETVKALISKGCYNWFEFNKNSRRRKKSS